MQASYESCSRAQIQWSFKFIHPKKSSAVVTCAWKLRFTSRYDIFHSRKIIFQCFSSHPVKIFPGVSIIFRLLNGIFLIRSTFRGASINRNCVFHDICKQIGKVLCECKREFVAKVFSEKEANFRLQIKKSIQWCKQAATSNRRCSNKIFTQQIYDAPCFPLSFAVDNL